MSNKDKLVKVSSLEETAQTIKNSFPTGLSAGGRNSLISVNIVDVDTLTDEIGLITFSTEISREVTDDDQIVFKYDDSLYFCDIYSITSQQVIDNVRYVVAVVKVIIVNSNISSGESDNPFLLPISQPDIPEIFPKIKKIYYGNFTSIKSGWQNYYIPFVNIEDIDFDDETYRINNAILYLFADIDIDSVLINGGLYLDKNNGISIIYRVSKYAKSSTDFIEITSEYILKQTKISYLIIVTD